MENNFIFSIWLCFRSRTAFEGLPCAGTNFSYLLRNWQEASLKSGLPAIGLRLGDLANRLQTCYHLTTAGKFSEAIVKLRQLLLAVPLLVVDSKQEVCTLFLEVAFFQLYSLIM